MNGLFDGLAVSSARSLSKMSITDITSDPAAASSKSVFVITDKATAEADAMTAYDRGCRAFLTDKQLRLPKNAVTVTAHDLSRASADISAKLYPLPDARFIIVRASKGATTAGLYLTDLLDGLGEPSAFVDTTGAVITKDSIAYLTYSSAFDIRRHLDALSSCGIKSFVIHASSPIASYLDGAMLIDADECTDCAVCDTAVIEARPSSIISVSGERYTVAYPPGAAVTAAAEAIRYASNLGYSYNEVRIAAAAARSRGRLFPVDRLDVPCIVDSARTHDDLVFMICEYRRYFDNITVVIGSVGIYRKERRREIADAINETGVRAILTSDNPASESASDIAAEIAAMLDPGIEYEIITDRRSAIKHAIETADKSTCVLLLGKGYENYQLIGTRKLPHDDAEIAANII